MIQLTENDFLPLETFELVWRWTSYTHALFSEQELAHIHPLTEAKAHEIWLYTSMYWHELGGHFRNATGGFPPYEAKVPLFQEPIRVIPAHDTCLSPHIGQEAEVSLAKAKEVIDQMVEEMRRKHTE